MNEGNRSNKSSIEGFAIAEGIVCLRLLGTISHVHVQPIIDWLEATITAAQHRALVIDCTQMEALEPGVAGRLIAHCRTNELTFEHTVVVSRAAAIIAIARAAGVVLKGPRVECAPSRSEALLRISASAPVRAATRVRRERQPSGEQPRPGTLSAMIEAKRNAG
jgi:anti-anti-sigma regulatory factor